MPGGELNIARHCTRSGTSDRSLSSVLTQHTPWVRRTLEEGLNKAEDMLDEKASFAVEVSTHAFQLNPS